MLRLASSFVPSRAVAEEVVQDAWLGVIRGIERFEGRSSLKTWLFRIVTNRARTTGVREKRHSSENLRHPAVPPDRFGPDGAWIDPPAPWADDAEDRLAASQALEHIQQYLDELPDAQRRVVVMRDFDGMSAPEVCEALGISEANQRVLLHRGRSKLRGMLEREMGKG